MRNIINLFISVILFYALTCLLSCKTPSQIVNVRLKLSSDLISKDSITHISILILTPDPGYLKGDGFSSLKKKETLSFSNLKSVGPGVFQLDSIPKRKFYLIVMTKINGIDLTVTNEPLFDLTKITDPVAEFDYKLERSFVRRYYDIEK